MITYDEEYRARVTMWEQQTSYPSSLISSQHSDTKFQIVVMSTNSGHKGCSSGFNYNLLNIRSFKTKLTQKRGSRQFTVSRFLIIWNKVDPNKRRLSLYIFKIILVLLLLLDLFDFSENIWYYIYLLVWNPTKIHSGGVRWHNEIQLGSVSLA